MRCLWLSLSIIFVIVAWTLFFVYVMLEDPADGLETPDRTVSMRPLNHSGMTSCETRPTAARLLASKEVSVAFPLISTRFQRIWWQKNDPDFPRNGTDSTLFPVEKDYRKGWRDLGVNVVKLRGATFVVSKQPQKPNFLCSNYPRHQVFNHLPFLRKLTVKSSLAETMRDFMNDHPKRAPEVKKLVPTSYWLNAQVDCKQFQAEVASGSWIQKKASAHNSLGVKLLSQEEALELASSCQRKRPLLLVQRYLPNPLLVNGHKCDFRVYLYVPVTVPLLAFFAPEWYMKCGHQQFNVSSRDLENVVTNTKVGGKMRKGANYNDLVLGRDQLQKQLSLQGLQSDFVAASLKAQMKSKLTLIMEAVVAQSPLLDKIGYELLGCDMMLDENLNLWLIEVNQSPQLDASLGARKTAVDAIVPQVVGTQLDLLRFAASGKPRSSLDPERDLPSKGSLELIYFKT